jgi:hypothetical protein
MPEYLFLIAVKRDINAPLSVLCRDCANANTPGNTNTMAAVPDEIVGMLIEGAHVTVLPANVIIETHDPPTMCRCGGIHGAACARCSRANGGHYD